MKPRSWSDAAFVEAVATHTNFTDVLRALGLRAAGGNHRSMKVHAERLGVDLRHFTQARRTRGITAWREGTRMTPERAFVPGSSVSRSALRSLCRVHLAPYACATCDHAGEWRREPLTLQLDHVNGDPYDHRLENLRWLCPNCHSQTGSFAGRGARRRPRAFGRELFSALPTR